MIDVHAFRKFMRANTPTPPAENDLPEFKARIRWQNQQYIQTVGLCYLLSQVFAGYVSATASEKLRIARHLTNPEVQSSPRRWADLFDSMAEDAVNDDHKQLYALASDLCAAVKKDDAEEKPITEDAAEEGHCILADLEVKGAA